MSARTIISTRVIPWDAAWGVHIRYSDGKHTAYPVGSQDDADDELRNLRGGSPAPAPAVESVG